MAGLEPTGRQLAYPVHGIDSDNGSVFIDETLTEYCGYRSIEFTPVTSPGEATGGTQGAVGAEHGRGLRAARFRVRL